MSVEPRLGKIQSVRYGMGGYQVRPSPTLFGWDGEGFRRVAAYPKNTVVKTAATGAACSGRSVEAG